MKKFFTFFNLIWIACFMLPSNNASAQVCCPEFKLKDGVEICPPEGSCHSDPVGGQGEGRFAACNESAHTYTVFPNDPAYTYTWTITGGTPTSFTGNPNTIVWGTGTMGYIKVVISNLAFGGDCVDSIMQQICLLDGPQADFNLSPDTVCQNTPVYFTNTSLGGSVFFWDFGDGNTFTGATPPNHSYALPGTYTVTLTAQDMGSGIWVGGTQGEPQLVPCGCIDTISKVVVVLPGQGPEIETDCCYGTVCPGDTSSFCTPTVCTTYLWNVTGGSIISGAGTSCIQVKWNNTYSGPTTVSLELPGCGTAPCPGTTTIPVPVLYPNLPINGPVILCAGASGSYTLPTLPGTYYTWTVNGGPYSFNKVDRNSPYVNITFMTPGTYWVKCEYDNPLAGCDGVDSLQVDILPEFTIFGNQEVCDGDIVPYYSSGPANWTVSPAGPIITGNGTNNINVTWSTGTYVVSAVPLNPTVFCNDSAFINVEVIAKPILNNIIGPDSICPGKNFTYSISSNTSGSPFIWDITGGTGNIQSEMGADKDSIIVKWTGNGPWQLEVYQGIILSSGDTCQSLVKTINVFPFPLPSISGSNAVCVDAVETYTAGGSNPSGNFQWTIIPSSQGSIQSGQGSNSVQILWHGTPNTAILKVSSCSGSDQMLITILNPPVKPVITPNGSTNYCLPAMPNNLSLTVPAVYSSYQWYHNGLISGATSNSYSIPNGTFTGAGAYVFSVLVSNGICSVSSNILILIGDCSGVGGDTIPPFICPTIDFTMNPNPACENQQVTFTASPALSGFQLAWDFGDASTSFVNPTNHIYTATGTYNVKLTATLGTICILDTTKMITVNPTPACTLTPADTIYCPGDSVAIMACPGMSAYQWYKNGSLIPGANNMTYYASTHGEYWAEVANGFGCTNNSDSVYIYEHPLPVAKITGDRNICADASSIVQVFLSTVYDVNYSYSWSSIPAGATFTPPTDYYTYASLTLPATLPVTYQFVVEVMDNNTWCINSDTICVTFFENPSFTLPYINLCEGTPTTLAPTPIDQTLFSYQWNNGATTPVITVSTPGFYSLTVTDLTNGCSTTVDAGFIHPKPDLSLFPLGCDDICLTDTFDLYIPLPLEQFGFNSTYPGAYPSIVWYANGNYGSPIGMGENLAYSPPFAGNYQISVVVQNSFGCIDTAGVFCLGVDTTVTIVVSTETPCGCDSTLTFSLVNANNEFDFIYVAMKDCEETFTLCVDNEATYNLVASNGITIYNAIVNGVVMYPGNIAPFMIGDNGLCCFAYADSSFVKILAPVTYTSDVVWDGKYYIDDNIIVTVASGAVLDITNVDVVFGECAGIVFQDSSYLRSTNSVYRPCNIDKTWKGLRFTGIGEFDNIINECTFKNAEVALYFQNGTDAVISSNLFSNCNYGVRVEGNNNFNHPISGNRFVTEQFFPLWACTTKYSFVDDFSTYGIYSTDSRLLEQVSQNEFVNTWGTAFPRTYGIAQLNSGALITENTFTDMTYSVLLTSALFPTNIENNKISVNEKAIYSPSSIYIFNCKGPVIEVNNNKISNNTNQFNSYSAIYASKSMYASIVNNEIDGFRFGIIGVQSKNFQISNNQINDCDVNGIYFYSPGKNDRTYITCNMIKMRHYNNTRGIFAINMTSNSEVSSNCVTDCYTSMDFRSYVGNNPLPLIRNNFLYNYSHVGINVQGHSGNIGMMNSPGLNTLWSNDNSSVDINSSSNITVADNFGMFNISWPQVQITSNNPYHSTASCGHQIFNMPSQGNLNISYVCDHFNMLLDPLTGGAGSFNLSGNYADILKTSPDQLALANMILTSMGNADMDLLNEMLAVSSFTENETALLKYVFYYMNSDFSNAAMMLNQFNPETQDEIDYKFLLSVDLKVLNYGWDALTASDISQLETIIEKETDNSNVAVSLLNNTATYRDYLLEEVSLPEVLKTSDIRHIDSETSYLNIYPNPASKTVFIELIKNNAEAGKLELFDVSGKRITDYSLNVVAGGIELDIQNLSEGFYFVTLTDPASGFIQKGKLVKSGKP